MPVLEGYKIDSFDDSYVNLKLEFTNKLYVSSEPDKDFVSVTVMIGQLFTAKSDNLTLKSDYFIKRITVPAQIPSDEEAENINKIANTATNGLLVSFLIPFIFMIFARVSMDRVWALYYML
jgi:hypothetical protein